MHTRPRRPAAVNVVTLGCSKNLVDSEVLLSQLAADGITAHHEAPADQAPVVVVNTCGFIDQAKEESINTILQFAEHKRQGTVEQLYVMGCLSARYPEELAQELPEVDGFFGTQDWPAVLQALGARYRHELLGERRPVTDGHYAYLKIADGCNRPCAFCAIPQMRGQWVSRPLEDLVAEARFLAGRGVKELMLIAQDLTAYGLDLYGSRRLADLLRALSEVEGIRWLRLHYAFPTGFPLDVLDVMRECPTVAPYLDMPLQHAADPVLRRMRRGITQAKTLELIDAIRQRVPHIALRTTFLLGFPGETEADVDELAAFVERVRFDRVGVFTYSHESGTHAGETLEDDVPDDVKQARADRIMAIQQGIALERNAALVGQTRLVVVDRHEGDWAVGRTSADSPEVDNEVWIRQGSHLAPGTFLDVRLTDATEYDLYAEPA